MSIFYSIASGIASSQALFCTAYHLYVEKVTTPPSEVVTQSCQNAFKCLKKGLTMTLGSIGMGMSSCFIISVICGSIGYDLGPHKIGKLILSNVPNPSVAISVSSASSAVFRKFHETRVKKTVQTVMPTLSVLVLSCAIAADISTKEENLGYPIFRILCPSLIAPAASYITVKGIELIRLLNRDG